MQNPKTKLNPIRSRDLVALHLDGIFLLTWLIKKFLMTAISQEMRLLIKVMQHLLHQGPHCTPAKT
jgi:hypothetical protein